MNKKNMFLTGLLAISAIQTALPAEPEQSKGWSKLCKTYATSLISGGLIGTATGWLSIQAIARSTHGIGQNKIATLTPQVTFGIIVPILVLIAENRLRSTLTDDINQNLEENEIKHNKNLIRDTAWIASWIAFLSCIDFNK
jgi:hypothetical protein